MKIGFSSPFPLALFLRAADSSTHPFDVGSALYLVHQARDHHDIAPGQIYLRSSATADARQTVAELAKQLHRDMECATWRVLSPCATWLDYIALVLAMDWVGVTHNRALLVCVVDEPFFRKTNGGGQRQDFFAWAVDMGILPAEAIENIPTDRFDHEAGVLLDLRDKPHARYYARRTTFDLAVPTS